MAHVTNSSDASRLVIFDVDGTLFQTEQVTVPAVTQACRAFHLEPPSRDEICSYVGARVEDYEVWLARLGGPGLASELIETANRLELGFIREYGRLYPGTRETLRLLKEEGFVLAVCSNGSEPYIHEVLNTHGLMDCFSMVLLRGTLLADKTAVVGAILDALRPRAFAVVGDREGDITAARAHQGYAIAAAYGYGDPSEWKDADALVQSIGEVSGCLRGFWGL